MFAIVGATGRVGYATCLALRSAGVPVKAIVRDAVKANPLRDLGCGVAVADVHDADSLANAMRGADAVQLILPPGPPKEDVATQMRHAIETVGEALRHARTERVLAISDYGAHIAEDVGMPSIFRSFEEQLGRHDGHTLILRSAEFMQNWARAIPTALASGILPSFHDPVEMLLPAISASDLGLIAADLLLRPSEANTVHAEGPRRYSANDVAAALSQLHARKISARVVPRSQWKTNFERSMHARLAELLIKTNDAHRRGGLIDVEPHGIVRHGTTDLVDALRAL
jgi:NAD(P)H dehydrogenase (quinone)